MSQDGETSKLQVMRARIDGVTSEICSLQLRYSRTDPYAVSMTLKAAEWCFARDLLLEALAGIPSGDGDVRIHCDGNDVCIMLTSPEGEAVVRVERRDAAAFAMATLKLVSWGSETDHVDVDAALAEIISPAG